MALFIIRSRASRFLLNNSFLFTNLSSAFPPLGLAMVNRSFTTNANPSSGVAGDRSGHSDYYHDVSPGHHTLRTYAFPNSLAYGGIIRDPFGELMTAYNVKMLNRPSKGDGKGDDGDEFVNESQGGKTKSEGEVEICSSDGGTGKERADDDMKC